MKKILLSISLLACSSLVSAQMTAEDLKEKDTEVAASLQHFAKKKALVHHLITNMLITISTMIINWMLSLC